MLFSKKGAKRDHDIFTYKEIKLSLSYVEIPVNLLYKPALGPGKLLLGFGPYVAYAVGGSVRRNNKDGKVEFKNEITPRNYIDAPYDAIYYAKRLDAGGNFFFGYEFAKKISIQLNAQLGIVNFHPRIEDINKDKSKAKNTGFGVSVGYRF